MKTQKTFTFFLKGDSIHEIEADDKDSAFRKLCEQQGKSWAYLHGELVDCMSLEDSE